MKDTTTRVGRFIAPVALCAAVLAPWSVSAAPVNPTSYSMPNGDGQASGGSVNYWDRNYTGAGSTTTDGAALSGGLGKLTDGVISTTQWDLVSNGAGTGEYVGWYAVHTLNPLITFSFSGNPTIDSISIQMDNSGVGGVFAPQSILIDGVNSSFTAPAAGTVGSVSFTGLGLTGNSHTIQFNQFQGTWTFVSEISFDDGRTVSAVPEPETYAMMLAGLGLLGFAARRRKKQG